MVYGTSLLYDNVNSDDFGLILVSFDSSSNDEETGLTIEPVYKDSIYGRINLGQKYSSVLSFQTTLVKENGEYLTRSELRDILSWLTNDNKLKWLKIFD